MKTYLAKILAVIILFSMTVAFVTGLITTTRSTEYMEAEIQEKLLLTSEKYANDFSAQFNHMEGLTDSLASYVTTSFDTDKYKATPENYLDSYEAELAEVIKFDLQTVRNAHSLYVTFNPKLTKFGREVWYIMQDGRLKEVEVSSETLHRDFTLPYNSDMAYFFEPQKKEGGVWVPLYLDSDINEEVFSYSRAIYVDGMFIGVAGADITAKDIVDTIDKMKLYPGGRAALLDKNYNMIVGFSGANKQEKELMTGLLNADKDKRTGLLEYEYDESEKILAYSQMDNGWTMAIIQPKDTAYASAYRLTNAFKILAIILALVLIVFLFTFSHPFIKKQTTLEKENREKDLMLMYQSRHAKLGEMFGNITHQWKQPLNTINLIMANLLDSYRYDDMDEQRLEKSVEKVETIINKMSETITDFSGFLKPTKEKAAFDINDCVKTAISLMEESINYYKITVNVTSKTNREVYGYYNEMTHVIFNILNNARDAIVEAGSSDRTIDINIVQGMGMIETRVRNPGEKIPEDVMEKIFEPYFTTKEDSGGTGLGLFISKQIIEEHMQGKLYIENIENGVMCRIVVPEGKNDEVGHED